MFYESQKAVSRTELQRVYLKLYHFLKEIVPGIRVGCFLPFSFEKENTFENHLWLVEELTPIDFFGYEANQNEGVDFEELDDERFALTENFITIKPEV